jgi:hypothetical protein
MSVSDITIRPARSSDVTALLALAALDSQPALSGDAVIAEVCGRTVAAIDPASGRAIADPFEPTADVVELLRLRTHGRPRSAFRRRVRRGLRPRLA